MNIPLAITAISWETPSYYPPPGFHPLGLFDIGNGDECGVYWPIGREGAPPLLCEMYHDSREIVPIASSLAGLVRIKALDLDEDDEDDGPSPMAEEVQALAKQYDIELLPFDSGKTPEVCLRADPDAPRSRLEAARIAFRTGDLMQTEAHLSQALGLLPEYTDALELMASVCRRQKKEGEAVRWALETLFAPSCFGVSLQKCRQWLAWLQSLPDDRFPEFAEDPLWQNRHRLYLDSGVKTSDDIPIFEEAIRVYLEQGKGIYAIRLRVHLGERMLWETISFAERYGYSETRHRELLRENLSAAGLTNRIPVLGEG